MDNTQIIDEVKKEIETKELAVKKEKIRKMLELIAIKEKEWGDKGKELNALKEQLDKEDFSAVDGPFITGTCVGKLPNGNYILEYGYNSTWNGI
jgi:hypothetical protein